MKKIYTISFFVLIFRFLDLYTTRLAIYDFKSQEQNLLVKFFHLDIYNFYFIEIILALFFVFCYIYSYNKREQFICKNETLLQYINNYFFKKDNSNITDWLFKMNLKRVIILFGSIVPVFIITTSFLFSLNNLWVYFYNQGNESAINYYLFFNDIYFFDILIFIFPPLFLLYLLYRKLISSFIYSK